MHILTVDDESLQLDKLNEAIREVVPNAEISSFRRPSQALFHVEEHPVDVAFLDVQMRGMTGVELAKLIIRLQPKVNIIFVTAYSDFKADAMDLRASGYITKPVNATKIQMELDNLRYPILRENSLEEKDDNNVFKAEETLLTVQCFGNFDAFDQEGKPIHFERTKAKEMLAYLVYKRGSRCTSRELTSILFEDEEYNAKLQDSFRHIAAALMKALRRVGAEKVVIRDHQNYAVDTSKISCDFYRFMNDDPLAKMSYTGEFISQYSWAEFMNAYLDSNL